MTGIIGRDREIAAARTLMQPSARRLALWGPPGVGKTTLARALVADLQDAAFVSLRGLGTIEQVTVAVTPVLAAARWVVLDGLDDVLDDAALDQQLDRWLGDRPERGVVLTSRRRLALAGVPQLEVAPLSPQAGGLLLQQAIRRHTGGTTPSLDELTPLADALDGLPLAIELAALQWGDLGTEALLRDPSSDVLSHTPWEAHGHGTLNQALAEACDHLDATQAHTLEAVATFAGAFDLQAVERVVGDDALERIESLRSSGLLHLVAPGRLRLLRPVRDFVRDRTPLDRRRELADMHAAWLIGRVARPAASTTPDSVVDDLCAAIRHLLDTADPRALVLLEQLDITRPAYRLDLYDHAVDVLDGPRARLYRSRALRVAGFDQRALTDVEAGLAMCPEDDATRTLLQLMVGVLAYERRDATAAHHAFSTALQLARVTGDRRSIGLATCSLATLDSDSGRLEASAEHYAMALDAFRAVADVRNEAHVLLSMGLLWHEQRRLVAAEATYHSAVALMTEHGVRMLAFTLGALGLLCHDAGRLDEAIEYHTQAIAQAADTGLGRMRCLPLARLAAARASAGDITGAWALWSQASEATDDALDPGTQGLLHLFQAFIVQAEGDLRRVDTLVQSAMQLTGDSIDARIALRVLRQQPGASPTDALVVGAEWFQLPGAEPVDLSRYTSLLRMFHALIDAGRHGQHLDVYGLFEAGWPGEAISASSIRNRVHVNLAKLRTLGLREHLVRAEDGYCLHPGGALERRAGPVPQAYPAPHEEPSA